MRVNLLMRQAKAAEVHGISRARLHKAIQSGYITTYETRCGLRLVRESDVRRYLKDPPVPGRKPK